MISNCRCSSGLLSKGVAVKNTALANKPPDTVVYLNETMLFWRVRGTRRPQANSKVRGKKKKTDEQQEEVRGL